MPQVSVIVPNYNHAKYLNKRIDTILGQTYQDFELILLDDHSTDNSVTILDGYRDNPKVSHIIFNEQNSGSTFKQWKKGVTLAAGKYIWIAESDDWCEPTLLETLINGIEQDKDCIISYCQSYCLNDDGKIIFQSIHPVLSELVDGHNFIQKYMSTSVSIFNASMALWRKDKFSLISENELISFKFCGDWYLWVHLAKMGKVHISAKLLNYFRKHDNDVSGKSYKSGLNFIEELKIINIMYNDRLIDERTYYKIYKKKFIDYWKVKDSIDQNNRLIIKNLFNTSLSPKTNINKLKVIALWDDFRKGIKRKK
ncbi:glycosyltransferase family 2 protein [Pedobacter sp. PWIIR3]